MADNSLDDFFAKKDKSKKGRKKNFTPEQLAKKIEESGKRPPEKTPTSKEKEKSANTLLLSALQNMELEDDEWREIEEKEVDLSGLKIHNLQIGDLKDEEQDKDRSDSHSEDGEYSRGKDGSGPWNKINPVAAAVPVVTEPEKPVELEEQKSQKEKEVYRAPHARTAAGTTSRTKTSSRTAPEIDSDVHFPSLSAQSEPPPKPIKKGPVETPKPEVWRPRTRHSEEYGDRGQKMEHGGRYQPWSNRDYS